MMKKIFYFIILFLFISLAHCSSVTAYWFSEPEDTYYYKNADQNRVSARAVTSKAVFEVWSASAEYPVLTGPVLVPVFPDEPPVLNSEHLNLHFAFSSLSTGSPFAGRILKESLKLNLDGKTDVYPDTVSLFTKDGNGHYEIMKTYTGTPDEISFAGDSYLEMTYFSAVYSQLGRYSFHPVLKLKSSDAECPLLNFRPERKRTYIPYRFPFSLPAVK